MFRLSGGLIAATTLAVSVTAAWASEPISFEDVDINGDGTLQAEEMTHAFGDQAQHALRKFDMDGDGIVTLAEVRASNNSQGAQGKDSDRWNANKERIAARAADRNNAGGGNRGNSGGNGGGGNGGGRGK